MAKVVISNFWHQPGIRVTLLHGDDAPAGGITLEIPLADFLLALAAEMDHPLKVWTRPQLEAAIKAASAAALEKIKLSSTAGVTGHGHS